MRTKPARLAMLPALVLVCAGVGAPVMGAEKISNRPAEPNEWGYRPDDGAEVRFNPPSLNWVHEAKAKTYVVQWSRRDDFGDAVTVKDVLWPTYTHFETLKPGKYVWRYKYRTEKNQESNWSQPRRFTVPTDAVEFPMPSKAQRAERIPKTHPRLFLRPEDLPRIRKSAKGEHAKAFNQLIKQADALIKAGPTPEPEHMGSARDKENVEMIKYWWPNRTQTEKACKEAEVLAFVGLITGDAKYKQAARRWILHLAAYDPDGPTNFALNCEAAKPMLYRLPRAYDWAYDALSEADRQVVRKAMARRVYDAWISGEVGRGVGHLNRPYSSHGNRTWHKIGEASIAFFDEIPGADIWLDYALNKFYGAYPVWSDHDGGWHEGISYWAGYMSKVVWWLQAANSALEIDGLKKPFFAQVGDFPLYVAPPGSPNDGFGDLSNGTPGATWGSFLGYFIRASAGRPEGGHGGYWEWWAERWKMRDETGVLGFLYDTNLPPKPAAKPPTDLPPSKIFHGIGVASLHTSLLDSRRDVHFLFKSSPFGSQSHGHNPQNSFQLNAYGEALLTTCVYRDLHGSKFHRLWAQTTVAHNAVLVDGEGQLMRSPQPLGKIVDEQLTPSLDYIEGDAAPAYAGRVKRAKRRVAFVKDAATPFLVVLDDLEAAKPATFQFMLHGLSEFKVDESNASLSLQRDKAGVQVRYLSSEPLSFRQWDGYEPKPTREFPNQWHVEAGTSSKRDQIQMITLIVPHSDDKAPRLEAQRVETPESVGVQGTLDGKPFHVAFRREGVTGSWGGSRQVDGPVFADFTAAE